MKAYSLTRKLVVLVLLAESLSAVALIAIVGAYEAYSNLNAFDVMLHGRADSMLGAVQDADDEQDNLMLDGTQSLVPSGDIYLVQDESGRVLGSRDWQKAAATQPKGRLPWSRQEYRIVRKVGTRIVDPGKANGGTVRHVIVFYGSPSAPLWRRVLHAVELYAAASLVLLLFSALLTRLLVRRGLASLTNLAAQAAQVGVGAWYLGDVSDARRVEELVPLIDALHSALAGLERSFMQQEQFVGDAAHELKTSVAVLKSSLQLLEMKGRTAEDYASGLERLREDCKRIEELVGSMLMLASLEAETAQRELAAECNLSDVLCSVTEEVGSVARLGGVSLSLKVEPSLTVGAPSADIHVLCSNLIHNAVQHSHPGGEVSIRGSRKSSLIELLIEDTGDGIPADSLPHVFNRFYRADASRSRATGGSGLGLAIARAIVTRAKGEIRIESVFGEGTKATVVFNPLKPSLMPEN